MPNNDIETTFLPSIKNGRPVAPTQIKVSIPEEAVLSTLETILSQFQTFNIANVMISNAKIQLGSQTYDTVAVTMSIDLGAG